ncbi:MAG: Hint domain-containing protein [Bauldia sp.]|nr:Hint domain-containing protein [Bauldia sp.]
MTRRRVIDYSRLLGFAGRKADERIDFRADGMADRVGAKVGAICLLRGTLVRTPGGDRPVEELAIGDAVVTVSGAAKPIRWIGRQRFRRSEGRAWVTGILPVRLSRGILGTAVPARDLYLSQAHALLLDGKLVPAGSLVNGRTVVLDRSADLSVLDYFNIELEAHDVVLAEGTPVETFLSRDGNREAFDNFVEYERLYGPEEAEPAAYAVRAVAGPRAGRIRSRLRNAFAAVTPRQG